MNACHSKRLFLALPQCCCFYEQEAILVCHEGGTAAITVAPEVSGCPLKEEKRSPLPEGCGDNVV